MADLYAIRNNFGRLVGGGADHDCRTSLTDINLLRNNFSGAGPGDTNGDGAIDLADLNAARNGLGSQTGGDLNRDGVIDLTDLNLLRNKFGGTMPIPEPMSVQLESFILPAFAGSLTAPSGWGLKSIPLLSHETHRVSLELLTMLRRRRNIAVQPPILLGNTYGSVLLRRALSAPRRCPKVAGSHQGKSTNSVEHPRKR